MASKDIWTLLISKDSCYYYFLILKNGERFATGEKEWYLYEDYVDGFIEDVLKEYNIEPDHTYWF